MEKLKRHIGINLISIFLVSTSLFIYEILITRMLSSILQYHFVFLTTSLAILGIGIGGLIVYKIKKNYSYSGLTLVLSLSYLICILLIYKMPFVNFFGFYSVLSSIPFIIGGMILSLVFSKHNKISNKLYFADLLGSTLGSILLIPLMDNLGFMATVFFIGSMGLLSTLLFSIWEGINKKTYIYGIVFFILSILLVERSFLLGIEKNFVSYFTSPITSLAYTKEHIDENVNISYTQWNSVARTDVLEMNSDHKTIITDGGASAPMIKFNGDLKSVEHLKKEINYLPFSIGNNKETLIIGSGGGKDILLALLGKSKNIDGVEINSSTVDAVKHFKEYNGDIYNYKGVNNFVDDGRNFIEKTNKKYNNIYLSMVMTNTANNGGLSLSENYIYTKEAVREYFDHLEDDGYLSFMFHGAQDMTRGINTAIEVLLERGIKKEELTNYFVAINNITNSMGEKHRSRISMPVVIFKKVPFKNQELDSIYREIMKQDRVIMNFPGLMSIGIYEALSENTIGLEELYNKIPFNSKPAIDDKPFFYDFEKGIPDSLKGLLITVFVVTIILFAYIIKKKSVLKPSIYFGLIGAGFMLIEIPLIQKSILFLGNPSRSFSYILFSLLLSCGIGSYLSSKKIFKTSIKDRRVIFIIIPLISAILLILLPNVINTFVDVRDIYKLAILTVLLFPLGFFMGMAFPQGIAKLSGKDETYIPLMWGVNGVMSVTGSVIALAISMILGFTAAIVVGIIMYILIFLFKL
ncbi:hypothetical protein [Dethiothermospora halolimnae]|uniref:hypothetical protein n=1 Tax=Dethiothermospora halolimnae TaxID=3114390 RepID=UPI003CCB831E